MTNPKAPTKHQLKSEATRTALLKAAEEIFARDGYERAQIDEIARQSGRTRGAVYSQYRTKEQLFFALQEQRIETAGKEMATALAKHPNSSDDAMVDLREYYADLRDGDAAVLDIELKLYAVRNPASSEEWRQHYKEMYKSNPREFEEVFGVSEQPGRSHIRSRMLALAALKGALILAMRFMPEEITPKETKLLLKEVFNGLFPTPSTSEPKQTKSRKPSRS
jgi:AcrR family transcriptional regulator